LVWWFGFASFWWRAGGVNTPARASRVFQWLCVCDGAGWLELSSMLAQPVGTTLTVNIVKRSSAILIFMV
jgi:hypothetical protein